MLELKRVPLPASLHCAGNRAYGTVQHSIFLNGTTTRSKSKSRVLENLKYPVPYQYRLSTLELSQCTTKYFE
jgi:hypothetical protein